MIKNLKLAALSLDGKAIKEQSSNINQLILNMKNFSLSWLECVVDNVNGYLIREKDSNDLISKIEKFILNPEIIRPMSISSRKIIEKRFSLNLISQEFLRLIKE